MPKEENKPMFFRCRTCGQSMDDENSEWIVDVRWPTKLQIKSDGQLAYMVANLEDQDIIQLFDLSEVICDACHGKDVEVKEWEVEEPWRKRAREAPAEEKDAADKDDDEDKNKE